VVFAGERSWAERDAALRACAVDLEESPPGVAEPGVTDDEVVFAGERSWAERDAALRACAIDLDDTPPRVPESMVVDVRASDPRVVESRITEPRVVGSRVAESRVAEARVVAPRVSGPRDMEPKAAEPRAPSIPGALLTDIRAAESRVADSRVVESRIAEPSVAEARVAASRVSGPRDIEPKAVEPRAMESRSGALLASRTFESSGAEPVVADASLGSDAEAPRLSSDRVAAVPVGTDLRSRFVIDELKRAGYTRMVVAPRGEPVGARVRDALSRATRNMRMAELRAMRDWSSSDDLFPKSLLTESESDEVPEVEEYRRAPDGRVLTFDEFEAYYRDNGSRWRVATPVDAPVRGAKTSDPVHVTTVRGVDPFADASPFADADFWNELDDPCVPAVAQPSVPAPSIHSRAGGRAARERRAQRRAEAAISQSSVEAAAGQPSFSMPPSPSLSLVRAPPRPLTPPPLRPPTPLVERWREPEALAKSGSVEPPPLPPRPPTPPPLRPACGHHRGGQGARSRRATLRANARQVASAVAATPPDMPAASAAVDPAPLLRPNAPPFVPSPSLLLAVRTVPPPMPPPAVSANMLVCSGCSLLFDAGAYLGPRPLCPSCLPPSPFAALDAIAQATSAIAIALSAARTLPSAALVESSVAVAASLSASMPPALVIDSVVSADASRPAPPLSATQPAVDLPPRPCPRLPPPPLPLMSPPPDLSPSPDSLPLPGALLSPPPLDSRPSAVADFVPSDPTVAAAPASASPASSPVAMVSASVPRRFTLATAERIIRRRALLLAQGRRPRSASLAYRPRLPPRLPPAAPQRLAPSSLPSPSPVPLLDPAEPLDGELCAPPPLPDP